MYVVYNNFQKDVPTAWEICHSSEEATEKLREKDLEWDVTDIDSFKSWYPGLIKD